MDCVLFVCCCIFVVVIVSLVGSAQLAGCVRGPDTSILAEQECGGAGGSEESALDAARGAGIINPGRRRRLVLSTLRRGIGSGDRCRESSGTSLVAG